MDVERALVSKIISTGQLEIAMSRGLRDDLFRDDDCRAVWDYLLDHQRRYRTPPSLAAVKHDQPKFEWFHVEDPLDYLLDKFVVLAKWRLAQDMVVELARACDDPARAQKIDQEFLDVSRRLATLVPSTEVRHFKAEMGRRIDGYERAVEEGVKPGIPFGFPWLDAKTGGIQPHEFVTVAGFSGLGKSTFLIATAFNAFMQDYTPLYVSLEMEASMLMRKWDAMAAGLDYTKLKQLRLPPEQIANWRKVKDEIARRAGEIPVIDSIRNCTPDDVYAAAVRRKPDLIVLDYITLMRSARPSRHASMWQTITEITQDLKQIARSLKIPILAAAQTNRSGAKDGAELDNIGFSSSIIMDSDIVLGLHADDEMRERRQMQVRLQKNRDGALGNFRCHWDHDQMLFRELEFGADFTRKRDIDVVEGTAIEITDDEPVELPESPRPRPRPRPGPRPRPRPALRRVA